MPTLAQQVRIADFLLHGDIPRLRRGETRSAAPCTMLSMERSGQGSGLRRAMRGSSRQ